MGGGSCLGKGLTMPTIVMFLCKLEFFDLEMTNSWSSSFLMKMIGLYDWSGNNPIIPELWLVPHFLPRHPGTYLVS